MVKTRIQLHYKLASTFQFINNFYFMQSKSMFDEAAIAIDSQLVMTSSDGHTFLAEEINGKLEYKMDHLACFAGKKGG
jgi:hypothetical protein